MASRCLRTALRIALAVVVIAVAGLALLIALRFGATAPPTRVTEAEVLGDARAPAASPAGVTLPDLVYFGSAWQLLNRTAGMPPIVLDAGYAHARIERTSDGLFFAGTVDRLDRRGNVTDVVLAFAGAQGVADFIQGNALAKGDVRDEPRYAATLFERVWNNPRYAHARIHVTGHSLGAGYAQFVGTEAIARHGRDTVAARVRIVAFGVPNWGPQAARYYHVNPHVLDGLFTGYTALNDPVISNGGTVRVGTSHFLPPFTGLTGWASIANVVAAHWPTTYMRALGLPDWLTPAQKASCIKAVSDRFITGSSDDAGYGRSGAFAMIVQGSAGPDDLHGTAGPDVIAGMGGRDTLQGGAGADRFLFLTAADSGPAPGQADEILDFAPGDRIDLSRLDADRTKPGVQTFTIVRSTPFTAPGQVALRSVGRTTWITGNTDRDGDPDFAIVVHGIHRPSPADLVIVPGGDTQLDPYVEGKASILR